MTINSCPTRDTARNNDNSLAIQTAHSMVRYSMIEALIQAGIIGGRTADVYCVTLSLTYTNHLLSSDCVGSFRMHFCRSSTFLADGCVPSTTIQCAGRLRNEDAMRAAKDGDRSEGPAAEHQWDRLQLKHTGIGCS